MNIGQKAHVYAFSSKGPRGNDGIAKKVLNSLKNLMLVCHECHEKMDQKQDGGRYTVELLRAMKAQHEERIERVAGISAEKSSHVLLYGAGIGLHSSPLNFNDTARALFPGHYPAMDVPIDARHRQQRDG